MTHSGPLPESAGTFQDLHEDPAECPKCKQKTLVCKSWDSSDGAYTDYKYSCPCGYVRWVDGIDS